MTRPAMRMQRTTSVIGSGPHPSQQPGAPEPACRDMGLGLFFPGRGESTAPARRACSACPILDECGRWAAGITDLKGIWAGRTEKQRAADRAAARKAAA